MQPLVSVVVPIYNVEKFLPKCLDSILMQDYPTWEAILVDDGSLDNSGKIAEEYAKKDSRFKVIHQKNGGLSAARNAGLDVIQGKYVMFLDSDDWWLSKTMMGELVKKAEQENWDIVIFGAYLIDNKGKRLLEKLDESCSGKDVLPNLLLSKMWTSVCNKFFRTWLWEAIRFPVGMKAEDSYIITDVVSQTTNIAIWERYWYGYNRCNETSISKLVGPLLEDTCMMWERRLQQVKDGVYYLQQDQVNIIKKTLIELANWTLDESKKGTQITEQGKQRAVRFLCEYGTVGQQIKAVLKYRLRYPIKSWIYRLLGKEFRW